MTRVPAIVLAVGLLSAIAPADAATRQKQSSRQYQDPIAPPGMQYQDPIAPPGMRRASGPPWAMPNECYIDEGYGRFSPCR